MFVFVWESSHDLHDSFGLLVIPIFRSCALAFFLLVFVADRWVPFVPFVALMDGVPIVSTSKAYEASLFGAVGCALVGLVVVVVLVVLATSLVFV